MNENTFMDIKQFYEFDRYDIDYTTEAVMITKGK